MEKLRYLTIFFTFVDIEEEKQMLNSCKYWIAEIQIGLPEEMKEEVDQMIKMIESRNYDEKYSGLITGHGAEVNYNLF